MKVGLKEFMEHTFNPLHIYCRMIDCGLSPLRARKIARAYELCFFKPAALFIPALRHQKQAK